MPYQVTNIKTGAVMGTYKTLGRATGRRDKLDNEYGGYAYTVNKIQASKKKSKTDLKIKKA